MFAQYSKMILMATVATSCFMMSCQKKGAARGVQPQTIVGQKPEAGKEKEAPEKDTPLSVPPGTGKDISRPSTGDGTRVTAPSTSDTTVATTPSHETDHTEEIQTHVSTSDTTTVAKPSTADTTTVATKPSVPSTSDTTVVKAEVKDCSQDVLNAQEKAIDAAVKTNQVIEDSKVSTADRIKAGETVLAQCKAIEELFAKEKITACIETKENAKREMTLAKFEQPCNEYGMILKQLSKKENEYSTRFAKANIEKQNALKKENLLVSEEAKELFNKKNEGWKMYIAAGKIQTSNEDLLKLYTENKVACSVRVAGEIEFSADTKMNLQINEIHDLKAENDKDPIKNGIDMFATLSLSSKSDAKVKAKTNLVTISCTHLKALRFNPEGLKAALGSHIKAETK